VSYDAFISYRHGSDAALATAIESALERIAKPWNRLRAMSVFRDQSDLAAEADLSAAITRTLDDTRYLVLIASPESAASPWVGKEIAYWCDERGAAQQLIVVLAGGELEWDDANGCLSPTSSAVSPAVRSRITTEPLYVDLRWTRDVPELSLRDSRFRSAMVLVAATVRGVAPADLESEDVRLHRRARRLARTALVTMAVLALVASVAAVLAVSNARRADQRARDALGRQLGLLALDMPASDADQAFLLSLVAADLDSSGGSQRFQASRALIGRYSRLERFLRAPSGSTSLRSVAISTDGTRIAASITRSGSAQLVVWPSSTGDDPTVIAMPADVGVAPDLSFLADDRLLVGTPGAGYVVVHEDGSDPVALDGAVAVDPGGGRAVLSTPDGSIELVALDTGAALARVDGELDRVDLRFARVVAAAAGELVAMDGTERPNARADLAAAGEPTAVATGPSDDLAAVTASAAGIVPWRRQGDELVAGEATAPPEEIGQTDRVVVAPDGQRALAVGTEGSAIVDLLSATVDAIDDGAVGQVAVDPSGRYAAVGGARLTIWDLETGRSRFTVPRPVTAMAWSGCDAASSCVLATVGESLDVWNPVTRRHIELLGQTNAQTVAISTSGSSVVTGGWGSNAAVWQLRPIVDDTGRSTIDASGVTEPVDDARFDERCVGELRASSPSGTFVVMHRRGDRTTVVCSAADGSVVASARLGGDASPVDAIAVDDDGNVAAGGGLGFVAFFRRDGSTFLQGSAIDVRLGGAPVDITAMASRDGTVAAGVRPEQATAQARAFVWPVVSGGTPTQFDADYRVVAEVALIGSATEYLVTAGRDEDDGSIVLQIWEAANSRRLGRALGGLSGDVVAVSGDDDTVSAADSDGNAFEWALDQDPTRDVCGIVGRPLEADEWRELADGALASFDYEPICPAAAPDTPVTSTGS